MSSAAEPGDEPATEPAPGPDATASTAVDAGRADGDASVTGRTDTPQISTSEKRFEVVATLLLAVAALATAWSGYQASLWDGIQSSDYSQASAARTEATQARTEANQFRLADLSVFENYVDAFLDGDDELTAFYRARFRDEFEVAFDAWMALDPFTNPAAPPSPLGMPEYRLSQDDRADQLERRAAQLFSEGEDANTYSDVYTMSTLLFAVVLFFAAVSERFEYRRMRIVLLALAAIGLVAGISVAIGQPVTGG